VPRRRRTPQTQPTGQPTPEESERPACGAGLLGMGVLSVVPFMLMGLGLLTCGLFRARCR